MRHSGILLHITSLPSPYGIGDLGPGAMAFIDFLKAADQKYWQVLPINPTDGINGHSPYSCFSAYAGNPLMISPQRMVVDGFLKIQDIPKFQAMEPDWVDYAAAGQFKEKVFNIAYSRFRMAKPDPAFIRFCKEQDFWLEDFALFTVAKHVFAGKCWIDWPSGLRHRQKTVLRKFAFDHAQSIQRVKFIQFLFFSQWESLCAYAHKNGVRIIGDIPIYVNYDSVDVWCYPQYFKLTPKKELKFVSGVPPDYFSRTGQRWGNPVYDWARLKKDKYSWWVSRIAHNLKLFDVLRIDHFRGFASFWQIPAREKLAVFGYWAKGPGTHFFKYLRSHFKHLPLIAEDLGEITPDVIDLMKEFHLPGMRVLLFGFGGDIKTNPHVPANYPANCVAYTGTHDNNTVLGYYVGEAKPQELANIPKVLGIKTVNKRTLHWDMVSAVMNSRANTAIIPLIDVLGLGKEARMNTPATKLHNWKWRLKNLSSIKSAALKLRKLTRSSQRI